MTVNDVDRKTKVDFISACLKRNNKKITKKSLAGIPDEEINKICEQFKGMLEDYIKNPPAKMTSYYVELEDGAIWEFASEDERKCKADAERQTGQKVRQITAKKNSHLCKYCGGITLGRYADELCDECKEMFGHLFYSEL